MDSQQNQHPQLRWLDNDRDRLIYLFAQGFGQTVGAAYRYQQRFSSVYIDPVDFAFDMAKKAIVRLKADANE